MSKNPYINLDQNEPYWQKRPDWYVGRHRPAWYESIDMNAISDDTKNDAVLDVIHRLVSYARLRDQVIEHRQKVAFHVAFMLRLVAGEKYSPEELAGILKMLKRYLEQMQVTSALDPDAPQPGNAKEDES